MREYRLLLQDKYTPNSIFAFSMFISERTPSVILL